MTQRRVEWPVQMLRATAGFQRGRSCRALVVGDRVNGKFESSVADDTRMGTVGDPLSLLQPDFQSARHHRSVLRCKVQTH